MEESRKEEFRKMLANFDTGVLVLKGPGDEMQAEPAALSVPASDGALWLALGVDADKPTEPIVTAPCLLVCERAGRHLTITGSMAVEREAAQVHRAWRPHWKAWFPEGPTARNLSLARFSPQRAEYWDHTGLMRLIYPFEAARSIVRGARRPPRREEHIRL